MTSSSHRAFAGLAGVLLLAFAAGCGSSATDGAGGAGGLGGGDAAGGANGFGGLGGLSGSGGGGHGPLPFACTASGDLFALGVVDHGFGPGQDIGQAAFPDLVLGAPRGAGTNAGNTDHVVALGDGGFVELSFGAHAILDGAGADFIVFENAFFVGGNPENPYAELARVSVSQDGAQWEEFPCASAAYPFDGCAGWHPVLAHPDENALDPTDPEVAGGDAFDLAELGLSWVRFVRIDDVVDEGQLAFDLDAVSVVQPGCFE